MKRRHINRFLEFFLIGLSMGILEDLIALKIISNAIIEWKTVLTVGFIALPFAAFSELVVDRKDFKFFKSSKDNKN